MEVSTTLVTVAVQVAQAALCTAAVMEACTTLRPEALSLPLASWALAGRPARVTLDTTGAVARAQASVAGALHPAEEQRTMSLITRLGLEGGYREVK